MAEIPRSSFIPKQTPNAVPTRVKKKRRFGALTLTGNVILIVSLLVGVGTFFYKDYLNKNLENTKIALEAERTRFNEADIASLRELDRQFSVARLLLEHHLSPSKIFDTLELTTKERIQFTGFEFSQQPSQDVALSIEGGTEEFKTVALQALTFGSDPLLTESIFTDITNQVPSLNSEGNLDQTNNSESYEVSFSVQGSVMSDKMLYDGLNLPENIVEEEVSDTDSELADEESESEVDSEAAAEGIDAETNNVIEE